VGIDARARGLKLAGLGEKSAAVATGGGHLLAVTNARAGGGGILSASRRRVSRQLDALHQRLVRCDVPLLASGPKEGLYSPQADVQAYNESLVR